MSLDNSRSRKRERDRDNQRLKRQREKDALRDFERRNASLERQVRELSDSTNDGSELLISMQLLQTKNEDLEKRLEIVDNFVKSWSILNTQGERAPNTRGNKDVRVENDIRDFGFLAEGSEGGGNQAAVPNMSRDAGRQDHDGHQTIPIKRLHDTLALPVWQRFPASIEVDKAFDSFGHTIIHLRCFAAQFHNCPADPNPADLFHGASLNELATAAFRSSSQVTLRLPEKLAINSMHYRIARWMIESSEESYNRIPILFRPTTLQLIIPHPPVFDYVVWPQMRDNFVKHEMKYCRSEVIDRLYLAYRVRGASELVDADWIDPTRQVNPVPKFLEDMSVASGWGLVDTFWTEYPELVEGLDPRIAMVPG